MLCQAMQPKTYHIHVASYTYLWFLLCDLSCCGYLPNGKWIWIHEIVMLWYSFIFTSRGFFSSTFHLNFISVSSIRMYACVWVSNGGVVWRFNSTADGIHFTFCLVEFVSKYIRRTWYLLYSSHLLFSSTKQHNIFCNHLLSINILHILKTKLFFTARM